MKRFMGSVVFGVFVVLAGCGGNDTPQMYGQPINPGMQQPMPPPPGPVNPADPKERERAERVGFVKVDDFEKSFLPKHMTRCELVDATLHVSFLDLDGNKLTVKLYNVKSDETVRKVDHNTEYRRATNKDLVKIMIPRLNSAPLIIGSTRTVSTSCTIRFETNAEFIRIKKLHCTNLVLDKDSVNRKVYDATAEVTCRQD